MLAALHVLIDFFAALPRVESPIPRSVGLGLPFTVAGTASVGSNLVFARKTATQRDRAASLAATYGFIAGAALYGAALIHQVVSSRDVLSAKRPSLRFSPWRSFLPPIR